ncbi:MAG: GNAT family N-acetyltransferase [Anaerolineales bacterium]|nr:GNAT family N-acetyltransferase [Anaerolineales bacterium]
MQIQVIQTLTELNALQAGWNALLDESAMRVPFLRHEYLTTWWETRGGGEWPEAELYVVTARDPSGQLVGIAPLFQTTNLEGQPALMFLGSIEISDYLDFIARPEQMAPFLEALIAHLQQPEAPRWEVIDLYNVLESSPSLEILPALANQLGLKFEQQQLQPAPYLDLPPDFETYLAGLDKKQRHEIRRKMRRAESGEAEVRWYIVDDETRLDAEIDAFLRLMATSPEKDEFLTDVMRTQMRRSVHAAFQAGWLQLAMMEINGEKAAAYLNFDFNNQIYVYNSGLNWDFGYYSPGWVMLAYLVQWAIENGRTMLDLMRGDEEYKYRFGGVNRYVYRVQIRS